MVEPRPVGAPLPSTGAQIEASQAAAAWWSIGVSAVVGGSKLMSNQVAIWREDRPDQFDKQRAGSQADRRRTPCRSLLNGAEGRESKPPSGHATSMKHEDRRGALDQPIDRNRKVFQVLLEPITRRGQPRLSRSGTCRSH